MSENDDFPASWSRVPYVAIGNDELGGPIGDSAQCPQCNQVHPVRSSSGGSMTMHTVECGAESLVVGLNGRLILGRRVLVVRGFR